MKKKLQFLIIMLLSLLLLIACGTAEEPKDKIAPDNMTADTEKDDTNEKDEVTTEGDTQSGENDSTIPVEKALNYTTKGKEYTSETTIVDEANYSIQLLEGYELTQEEPGRDVLFLQENDAIFMRIEVIQKNDSSFDNLVANTEELMTAINEQYDSYEINNIKEHKDIKDVVAYIGTHEEDEVVGVVFEKENILVRLTVFDKPDYDLKDALIQMGLTIEEK